MDSQQPSASTLVTNGHTGTLLRCAVYCRYSSESQRNSMSIEAQRHECLSFLVKQQWSLYKVFVDEARSGTSDDRAAFQAMIAEAAGKTPPFNVILVHKLDRFARNRYDSIKYKSLLRRKGVKVISATQPIIGSGDPTEVLLEAMLEGMDEFYSLNLARESLKGMAENARHGWWNGGHAPFGFKPVASDTEKGPKKKLVIEPAEAEIVRQIFSLYRTGRGVGAIRHLLNTEGVRFRGGRRFTKNVVLLILRNEKYCGDATFGKKVNRRQRPMDWKMEPITIKDAHEPIVDRQAWAHVQELLSSRRRERKHPRAVGSDYLLSGLITCGFCGANFVGVSANSRGRRYRYYVCNTQRRAGSTGCQQPSLNATVLERIVLEEFKSRLTTRETIVELIKTRNDLAKDELEKLTARVAELEREIEDIAKRRGRLYQFIEQHADFKFEDLAPRIHQLETTRAGKEQERDQLKATLAAKSIRASEQDIEKLVEFYAKLLQDESSWAKKQVVQYLVVSVKIKGAEAQITYDPALTAARQRLSLREALTAASDSIS